MNNIDTIYFSICRTDFEKFVTSCLHVKSMGVNHHHFWSYQFHMRKRSYRRARNMSTWHMSKLSYSEMKFFSVDSVASNRSLKSVKVSYSVSRPRPRNCPGRGTLFSQNTISIRFSHKKEKLSTFANFRILWQNYRHLAPADLKIFNFSRRWEQKVNFLVIFYFFN